MKLQFKILMFFMCLNLSTWLVVALALPGTEEVQPVQPPIDGPGDYEEHFDPEEIAEGWSAEIGVYGLPLVGDIFSAFYFMWRNVQYLIDGFPMFLNWVSDSYMIDATAKAALDNIALVIRAIYYGLMSFMLIEFIAGRYFTE